MKTKLPDVKTATPMPTVKTPKGSKSTLNGGLSASAVIMWLSDEIDRLEYPVGSLDIPRDDRERVAIHLSKAREHIRKLQEVGR